MCGTGAALAPPFADTEAMQLHLDEIAVKVAVGAHAVLIFDRAGWHTTSNLVFTPNCTPIWLPSRGPELNPVETVWQYLRANWLSNSVFETCEDIIDAACDAWRNLTATPDVSAPEAYVQAIMGHKSGVAGRLFLTRWHGEVVVGAAHCKSDRRRKPTLRCQCKAGRASP